MIIKNESVKNVKGILSYSYTPFLSYSKEPKDGTFIQYENESSFSQNGVVRYGEETDVDDI